MGLLAPTLAVIGALAAFLLLPSPALNLAGLGGGDDSADALTAVIVDQLGATQPNPDFSKTVTDTLEQAGYAVDYVPPEDVTVDYYRRLPENGYDLIVLRTHSTAIISRGEEDVKSVSLFTNEPYTRDKYTDEQLEGRIGFAEYETGGDQIFGITSEFITKSMQGDFGGATLVMMGCQGLTNDLAAQAFRQRGAGDFISWDGLVTAVHTDQATQYLLRQMAIEQQPTEQAVTLTMDEFGPDPHYGSRLEFR